MSEFETLDGFATGSLPSECAGGGSYSYGYSDHHDHQDRDTGSDESGKGADPKCGDKNG